jgi:hypothetical protein
MQVIACAAVAMVNLRWPPVVALKCMACGVHDSDTEARFSVWSER